jgi:signal transduction histidine kinase
LSRERMLRSPNAATISQSIPKVWSVLNDPDRLNALEASALLDSPAEDVFDRFTRMASRVLKVPVTLVSLVDNEQQFFKSQFGLTEPLATKRCTPLTHSYCQFVVASGSPLIVDDAREHPLLRDNLAIRDNNVIAYLGMPLTTREEHTLGSFCCIDHHPRVWTEDEIQMMRDLAAFVVSEIELRLLARHYQENYLKLRQLEIERDELVHMLVHDLRNPLSSMISGLEAMKTPEFADEADTFLDLTSTSARSLLHMITDILDVSKADAGRLTLDIAPVDVRELIVLASGMVGELAGYAGVKVEIDVKPGLPPLEADREKLRRVLVNLISNSIQHTPRNGRVTVSAKAESDLMIFAVTDTGCGIPTSAFSQIFEKFGKNVERKCGRVSSGLGLHFCKMAIEAHGGHIGLESEIGKGTTFRFDVPLKTA